MGESGSRRSTLVSRLPIFRRSASKRQDSLPSSPSSGGVANGVHTSSPSSTNSSSSSTGKRRSLFRTPSLSFHAKRSAQPPRPDPAQPSLGNGGQAPDAAFPRADDSGRGKTRHSFGFGGHRHKKITRSQTEDFEKASSNRSLFINCISSGTNEGDDSGFLDDYSGSRRSSKHKKQLLPKSFSSHHRFSRQQAPAPEPARPPETGGEAPGTGTPGSCPGELGESSLQSPMLSEDRTTAVTPSEFVPVTEDSVSEAEPLPVLSPTAAPDDLAVPGPASRPPSPPPAAVAAAADPPPDAPGRAEPPPDPAPPSTEQAPPPKGEEPAKPAVGGGENRAAPSVSDPEERLSEPAERRPRNAVVIQEPGKGTCCVRAEARPTHLRKPHAGTALSRPVAPFSTPATPSCYGQL